MLKSTRIVAALAALSLVSIPTAAFAKKSADSLPAPSGKGLAKKIDPTVLEILIASCELPGKRIGHYISNGKGHPNGNGRGHACDADSPG